MRKVMTIVGTRPELIKLSLVLKELDQSTVHILVHTGQNFDFELNEVFFQDLGIRKPDHFLNAAGKTAMETVAQVLVKTDELLEQVKPDAVLLYGDTNSCLAAIAIKRKKIPLFHMEAGNRCFDQRVPEDLNRKVVDHLSDVNMPLTEHGRRYLIREGIPQNMIYKTGSCMLEVLNKYKKQIEESDVLHRFNLKPYHYFVVSAHREENVDQEETLIRLMESLNSIVEKYDCPVVFSVHPRTQKRLDQISDLKVHKKIHLMKPLGFHDYVHLQKKSRCVISDSGTLMEEASILGFPAILARESHERPEGMDVGILIMAKMEKNRLLEALHVTLSGFEYGTHSKNPVPDYQVEQVSKMAVKVILSHIDYINRVVWHKEPEFDDNTNSIK